MLINENYLIINATLFFQSNNIAYKKPFEWEYNTQTAYFKNWLKKTPKFSN